MHEFRVQLGERSYPIIVTTGDLQGIGAWIADHAAGALALVVTDRNALPHAKTVRSALPSACNSELVILPPGEEQKSLAWTAQLYDALAQMHADRRTLVVAVGGGVVGDLAGFAAATFNRGMPLFMVPTTLLAMVDSSVGGKVGINHPLGKNLIGAFHQPIGVWIDTATLETLPEREFRSGLAEVVKYGVILDADFFAWQEQNADAILQRRPEAIEYLVLRCCRLKADIVEKDEREEKGLRVVLNYGHTFAHAFETVAGYGHWLHGEAVAMGMLCASRLAQSRGLIPADVTERQLSMLQRFHLPVAPERRTVSEWLEVMRRDKKAQSGRLRFVLPRRLGEVGFFDDVPEADVIAVLQE